MPTLLFLNGPRSGTRVPVVGDRFVLGRATECDAVVSIPADPKVGSATSSVSRRHAVITCADGLWYIEDGDGQGRGSHNGTYVNGRRVPHPSRVALRHDDQIRICDARLAFHFDPESTFTPQASVSHADSRVALEHQSADRLCALLDVSAALRATLEPDAVLDRTLEHLFRMFPQAERGIVVSREDATGPLALRALRTPGGEPADPRFSTTVVGRCLEGVEAVLGDDLPVQFPNSLSLSGLSVRSLMCAPLWTPDGRALGAVQLDTRADDRKFTADDLRLLLGVASQASVALSNARLHRESLALQRRARDLEVAQQVQRALLPRSLPEVPGYAFHSHYAAADEVGGDYYDFVPLPGGRLAVLLGDVAGHGVAAALVMARFGAEARACLEAEADPAAAVTRLNALVLRATVPDSFVTLAAVVLDPVHHVAVVVSAGHPAPLLRRADGSVEESIPEESIGLPLGIAELGCYERREVRLGPGEAVLLFSDGVTESLDAGDHQFGSQGVRAVLASAGPAPRATGEALTSAVRRHAEGCDQNDDITLVCLARAAD
jgi:serine phosphatase RsbU (regulator of sigma subunit)/pSer/pThr/pTyr-binding forkhead associated (FHA) protein